jgi:hypothetical protein
LIAGLILFCVVKPEVLRSWLGALGVSKATLFGFELTPGSEKTLATTIDTLKQQRDAAIFERNSMAKKAEDALHEVERLKGADPVLSSAIASIQASAMAASESSGGTSTRDQTVLVENARHAIDAGGRWAVVYGGNFSMNAALTDMSWAGQNGLEGRKIVKRKGVFASAILTDSPESAQSVLDVARRRRPDAYIVNLQTWCSRTTQQDGVLECTP